jgi:hypothetical protein
VWLGTRLEVGERGNVGRETSSRGRSPFGSGEPRWLAASRASARGVCIQRRQGDDLENFSEGVGNAMVGGETLRFDTRSRWDT